MAQEFLGMVRGQRRAPVPVSKQILLVLAVVCMIGSAIYWWSVQHALTPHIPMAVAMTLIMVLAPPALMSFLIPWSPGGMLLQKIQSRTYGYVAVMACAVYLVYYSFQLQWSWWAAQPVAADSGLVYQQVMIGIIGFIVIPALIWTPVTSDELMEQVRQAHLVKRYELQTQADIAILRSSLLRAQELALLGFANLTLEEREELALIMHGLVRGLNSTLREIGESVKTISGTTIGFDTLEDNEDVRGILDYLGETLIDTQLDADQLTVAAPAGAFDRPQTEDEPSPRSLMAQAQQRRRR